MQTEKMSGRGKPRVEQGQKSYPFLPKE